MSLETFSITIISENVFFKDNEGQEKKTNPVQGLLPVEQRKADGNGEGG
jgi:hypothetical protein